MLRTAALLAFTWAGLRGVGFLADLATARLEVVKGGAARGTFAPSGPPSWPLLGDVVIMEGEWGTVEEITLSYVVLKVWDLRRLVIPIGRVLETPFQNWSRAGTELLGTVMVHADYGVPVEAVRAEVQRFARSRPEWDGKVAELHVTDATPRTVELRALVSAPDAGKAWDLRCALREDLVGFLQRLDGGRYLPRLRIAEPEPRVTPTDSPGRPTRP